ncbi:hypothetical protein niasHT_023046 [Heterodera trifolii]|uniref:Uncharacterized protein n=1 Tax=Heterodera trifolii TaxID=157864 RepID=A0ABD2KF60_9BILA
MQNNQQRINENVVAKFRTVFWRNQTANDTVTTPSSSVHYCMCCGKLHNKNDSLACEGDMLREYWDDYLHIQ